jgi:hypothetical protein
MKNLAKLNTRALEDYIANAPAAQQVPPPPRWQKYHRKYDSAIHARQQPGDKFFQSITSRASDNDPNFMLASRHVLDRCRSQGAPPRWQQVRTRPTPRSSCRRPTFRTRQLHARRSPRGSTSNPNYPFVIAVHRYRLCAERAGLRPDVARLTFPAGTPPGRYVAQWQWRGYYDIVDIEIVAGTTPVAKPYGDRVPLPPAGVPAQYKRVDHCAFPDATPVSKCMRIMTDARACMDMCDRLTTKLAMQRRRHLCRFMFPERRLRRLPERELTSRTTFGQPSAVDARSRARRAARPPGVLRRLGCARTHRHARPRVHHGRSGRSGVLRRPA